MIPNNGWSLIDIFSNVYLQGIIVLTFKNYNKNISDLNTHK